MADNVDSLTDVELRTKLAEFGFPVVPITTTTRKVMAKKLRMLMSGKNSANSRRSLALAKYSSEEESDEDVTTSGRGRRATIASGMLPPPPKHRTRASSKPAELVNGAEEGGRAAADAASQTTSTTTVTTTTRNVRTVLEQDVDMDTGSDSEPEQSSSIYTHKTSQPASKVASPNAAASSTSSYASKLLSGRSPLGGRQPASTEPQQSTTDRLNQIRSRLSLGSSPPPTVAASSPLSAFHWKTIAGGDDMNREETPFLSNFSKRMSRLSTTLSPGAGASPFHADYNNYRNDVIKEHDANGAHLSAGGRSYFGRLMSRGAKSYPHGLASNHDKSILRYNFVSFALLAIVIAFFVGITLLYMGIRTEQGSQAPDVTDYVIPFCTGSVHMKAGINCVQEGETTDALNLLKVLRPELAKRAMQHACSDPTATPYMSDDAIIEFVAANYALKDPYEIQKSILNLQVLILKNPKWDISIVRTDHNNNNNHYSPSPDTALQNMDDIVKSRSSRKLALVILNPALPWRCVLVNKLYTIITSLLFIAAGFSVLCLSQKVYKYMLRRQKCRNDQLYSLVDKIIDIFQANAPDDSANNFLAVNHVRDMLIAPQDRKRMAPVWTKAVKFIQENESRIRTEIQIVAGEEFHVWRWLDSTNLNASNASRSKSWQGQAFETQVGSVNSLPCSPTPCLKIRGMLDEKESPGSHSPVRLRYAVRDAVLSKCAQHCKLLHCELDLASGCVYLKCASQADAAVAYRNLHGWWYDGHLVTVKYLRLERYMQRFPSSPGQGPPYLTATAATAPITGDADADADWMETH